MAGFALATPGEYNSNLVGYIDVVAFGNVGEAVMKNTKRGSKVCVTGSIESHKPEGEEFGKLEPLDDSLFDDEDDDCPF